MQEKKRKKLSNTNKSHTAKHTNANKGYQYRNKIRQYSKKYMSLSKQQTIFEFSRLDWIQHEMEANGGKYFQTQINLPALASISCQIQSNRQNTKLAYYIWFFQYLEKYNLNRSFLKKFLVCFSSNRKRSGINYGSEFSDFDSKAEFKEAQWRSCEYNNVM